MWWLLCGFLSLWSESGITRLPPLNLIPFPSLPSFFSPISLSLSRYFCYPRFPMKEIKTDFISSASHGDSRIRFKYQNLLQDYQELRKETEVKIRKLEMVEQHKLTLEAQVKFLRHRYKQLTQEQTPESGDLKMPSGKRKKQSGLRPSDLKQKNIICNGEDALANNGSCDLEKKPKRSRGNEVLTNSVTLPDLNAFVNNKVPGFDLNQISREEEEPEANAQHMVMKNAMLGNGIHGGIELPICRDLEKELNRATVKRKVSWQDPVALRV